MANQQGQDMVPKYVEGTGLSTASVADILTYTCPANKNAIVVSYNTDSLNAAVTVQPQLRAGHTHLPNGTPGAGAATQVAACTFPLNAGDVFAFRCTVNLAATTCAAYIGVREEL